MASSCCSRWWHALFYVPVAALLAVIAISSAFPSHHVTPPDSETTSGLPSRLDTSYSTNATIALRRSGFVSTATLLQLFPERLLTFPEATIFAIPDASFDDFSIPSWLLWDLLNYHSTPSKLSFQDLSNMPPGSCLPTNLPGKIMAINRRRALRSVEINGVLITRPDVFLDGPYAIHGIQGPFFTPGPQDEGISPPTPPNCHPRPGGMSARSHVTDSRKSLPWNSIVRALSSRGFISFSIGLRSVLEGVVRDFGNLSSVTVLAPIEGGGFPEVASPSPLLETSVRFHILPRRFSLAELSKMPNNATLGTLVPGQGIRVVGTSNMSTEVFSSWNQVEIVEPEAFSSKEIVIHGVSRAFDTLTVP